MGTEPKPKQISKKDYHEGLSNSFFGKTTEVVRNRLRIEFVENTDGKKILHCQSRLHFNAIHKSYENYDIYTFKKDIVRMEKPIYLDFAILELNKLLMYET